VIALAGALSEETGAKSLLEKKDSKNTGSEQRHLKMVVAFLQKD
jgi:hypothetical protein